MAAEFRIKGIVRLADGIAAELAHPVTPSRKQQLRELVVKQLEQIAAILKDHGFAEHQLPIQSRKAVAQLRMLLKSRLSDSEAAARAQQPAQGELFATPTSPPTAPSAAVPSASRPSARAPVSDAPASPPADEKRRFSSPTLSRRLEQSLRILAQPIIDAQAEQLRTSLEQVSRGIELEIRRLHLSHAQLTRAFREQRGWTAMMSQPSRMAQYRNAQKLCRDALLRVDRQRLGPSPSIEFRPMRGLYRFRGGSRGSLVQLAMPMMAMDAAFFDALARMMLQRTPQARQQVLQAVDTAPYQSLRIEFETLSGRVEVEPGVHHDLSSSFHRVNAAFFGGAMPRPRLVWSRSSTHRIMGYYRRTSDVLMISRTLDRPEVDPFVLDFLMYHELLHKKHGTRWSRGRGYVHTPAFYADEHRFPRHEEADKRLSELAREAASSSR